MEMSPYKFDHGSSLRQPDWVHVAPIFDVYGGKYRLANEELNNPEKLEKAGQVYADMVKDVIEKVKIKHRFAKMLAI